MARKRVVIVGGVVGGASCAARLRDMTGSCHGSGQFLPQLLARSYIFATVLGKILFPTVNTRASIGMPLVRARKGS